MVARLERDGGMSSPAECSRQVFQKWTHSAVATSTSSTVRHGPRSPAADDRSAERIDRRVAEPGAGPDIGDVGHSQAVGGRGTEDSLDEIRRAFGRPASAWSYGSASCGSPLPAHVPNGPIDLVATGLDPCRRRTRQAVRVPYKPKCPTRIQVMSALSSRSGMVRTDGGRERAA
jgi:hypothetical protein